MIIAVSIVFIILGFIFGVSGSHYLEKKQLENSVNDLTKQKSSLDVENKAHEYTIQRKNKEVERLNEAIRSDKLSHKNLIDTLNSKHKKLLDAKSQEILRLKKRNHKK